MKEYKSVVAEICDLANLEDYKDVISSLYDVIEHNGCGVCYHTIQSPSVIQYEGSPQICLAVKYNEKPIHTIWDLIHEYGHFLSGPPKAGEALLDREKTAWNHARKLVLKHARLMPFLQDFKEYKERSLDNYRHIQSLT